MGAGFACPRCEGQCRLVVETRADESPHQERVLRVRRCPDCGYEKRTVELDDERSLARIPDVGARLTQLRRSREAAPG